MTISIVALLLALTVPAVLKARERAQIAKSGNNLRQIFQAFMMYVGDHNDQCFWRAPDPGMDGMDWFVHGGRSTGNASAEQGGLFNRIDPRPLNSYVGLNSSVFRHPSDARGSAATGGVPHFELYGNDYAFNSLGYPGIWDKGLSGTFYSNIQDPGLTIVFLEAHLLKSGLGWAGGSKGNIMLADGRMVFTSRPPPDDSVYRWGP